MDIKMEKNIEFKGMAFAENTPESVTARKLYTGSGGEVDYLKLFKPGFHPAAYKEAYRHIEISGTIPAKASRTDEDIKLSPQERRAFLNNYNAMSDFNLSLEQEAISINPPEATSAVTAMVSSVKVGWHSYKHGIDLYSQAQGKTGMYEDVEILMRERELERWNRNMVGRSGWVTMPGQVVGNLLALGHNAAFQDAARVGGHAGAAIVTEGASLTYTLRAAAAWDIMRSSMGSVYGEAYNVAKAYGANEGKAKQIAYDIMMEQGVVSGVLEAGGTTLGLSMLGKTFSVSRKAMTANVSTAGKSVKMSVTQKIAEANAKKVAAFAGEESLTEGITAIIQENAAYTAANQTGGEYIPDYVGAFANSVTSTLQGTLPVGIIAGGVGTAVSSKKVKSSIEAQNRQAKNTAGQIVKTVTENPELTESQEALEETARQVDKGFSDIPTPLIPAKELQSILTDMDHDPEGAARLFEITGITPKELTSAINENMELPISWGVFSDMAALYPDAASKLAKTTRTVPEAVTNAIDIYAEKMQAHENKDAAHVEAIYEKMTDAGITADDAYAASVMINEIFKNLEAKSGGLVSRDIDLSAFNIVRKEGKKSRGQIDFTDKGVLMTLFDSGDISTVLHETAHYLRRLMSDLSTVIDDAPLKADIETVNKFVKAEDGKPWTRKQEELFAGAFEKYLMTGRAPNNGILKIFEYIKNALVSLYGKAKTNFPELSTDITSFFDRMLDTEIHAKQFKVHLDGIISNNFDSSTVASEIDSRVMTERGVATLDLFTEFKEIAENDSRSDPRRLMVEELTDMGGLNREHLNTVYSKVEVEQMGKNHPGLITENGLAYDEAAELMGMNWERMISEIQSTLPANEDIAVRASILEAEHASINPVLDIPGEAERTLSYLLVEKLETEQGNPISSYAAKMEATAYDEYLETLPVENIKTSYEQIKSKKDILETEINKALPSEEPEVLNQSSISSIKLEDAKRLRSYKDKLKALGERLKTIHQVESKAKRIMRMKPTGETSSSGVSAGALEQVKYMLVKGGFSVAKIFKPEDSLKTFILNKQDNGFTIVIPEWIADGDYPARKNGNTTYRSWEYSYIREFSNAIDSILHTGRLENKLNSKTFKDRINQTVDIIYDTALSSFKKHKDISYESVQTSFKLIDNLKSYHARTIKTETALRRLDGTLDSEAVDGAAYKAIYKPIEDAYIKKLKQINEISGKVKAAIMKLPEAQRKGYRTSTISKIADRAKGVGFVPYSESLCTHKFTVDGAPHLLTREEMLMVALNSGNPGGRAALIKGNGFTENGLQSVWDMLSLEETQLVTDIWKAVEPLYDPLAETVYKSTGVRLEKVRGVPLMTKAGIIDGGYFPMVFDKKVFGGIKDSIKNDSELMETLMATANMRVSPKSRASMNRAGGKHPLFLNFGVLDTHITDTIHDITHRETVQEVGRIIMNKKFKEAVARTLGDEYNKHVFENWLAWNAKPKYSPTSGLEAMVETIRRNSTVATMGYSFTVALLQFSGVFQSIDTVGTKWMLQGLMNKLSDFGGKISSQIDEMSPVMAERRRGVPAERDLQEFIGSGANMANPDIMAKIKQNAFVFIGKMDMLIADATFMAAYEKALSEGKTEAKAIELADQVVRTTQTLSAPKDSAAVQHGSVMERVLTMYYTFFSGLHNRLWLRAAQAKEGTIGYHEFMSTAAITLVMPALFDWLIGARRLPENEDDFTSIGAGVVSYAMAGLPGVRDITNAVIADNQWRASPMSSGIESVVRAGGKIKSGQFNEITALDVFKSIGFMNGIPGTQQAIRSYRGSKEFDSSDILTVPNLMLGPVHK